MHTTNRCNFIFSCINDKLYKLHFTDQNTVYDLEQLAIQWERLPHK